MLTEKLTKNKLQLERATQLGYAQPLRSPVGEGCTPTCYANTVTNMKVDVNIIKLPNKDIFRYEIYIEGYHYTNSMRFPIKNKSLIEDEFNSAIELYKQENEKDVLKRVYRAVKVIDRAKAQIIKEHKFN